MDRGAPITKKKESLQTHHLRQQKPACCTASTGPIIRGPPKVGNTAVERIHALVAQKKKTCVAHDLSQLIPQNKNMCRAGKNTRTNGAKKGTGFVQHASLLFNYKSGKMIVLTGFCSVTLCGLAMPPTSTAHLLTIQFHDILGSCEKMACLNFTPPFFFSPNALQESYSYSSKKLLLPRVSACPWTGGDIF